MAACFVGQHVGHIQRLVVFFAENEEVVFFADNEEVGWDKGMAPVRGTFVE